MKVKDFLYLRSKIKRGDSVYILSEAYQESIIRPENFCAEVAKEVQWFKPYEKVFDDSQKPFLPVVSRWGDEHFPQRGGLSRGKRPGSPNGYHL